MTAPLRLEDLALSGNLPSLPAVALRVLQLVQDPDATIDDLTAVLGRDPALAAKVLQMANSPLFNRGGGDITSLERSAVVLGFRAVKVIALGFSLHNELPTQGERAGLDLAGFWHRSLVNAVIGRLVARRTGSRLVEEAFLAGLLADLGKLILAQMVPERYGPVVQASGGWPNLADEQAALGFDSVDVGVTLLRSWGLPSVFCETLPYATRFIAPPDDAPREVRELVEVLRLGLRAGQVLFDADKGQAMHALTAEAQRMHGFSPDDVDGLMDQLHVGVAETAAVFDLRLPSGVSYQSILEAARLQMAAVSLDTTVTLRREQERVEEFRTRASTDALTGLANRAAFDEFLTQQLHGRRHGRVAKGLGLAVVDIDYFKKVNDSHGHQAGDAVLRTVAGVLAAGTRRNELVARYGGEEFALIAPATDPVELRMACERLRAAIAAAETTLPGGVTIRVTASIGAASVRTIRDANVTRRLIERADEQLYFAKRRGRNRVEVDPRQEI